MNNTANAFIYGATQSIGDTAIAATLTAARWGVMGWEFVTQPAAIKTYRWVGAMTVALAQLAFWSAVWVMAQVKDWVDGEVAAALPQPVDHIVEANEMVEVDPFCPTVNPLPVAQPAAKPTLAQLRKRCIAHNKALPAGAPRRIARAARLTKAETLNTLSKI